MNSVFLRKHFLLLIITFITPLAYSQQSVAENSVVTTFNNALKLYNNKAYIAAQKKFANVENTAISSSNLKSDAAYYEAMSAIKLNQTDADKKVLKFVEENPNSNKKNKAYYNVANYYFANKKAAYALKWYQKVVVDELSEENIKELNYKMGYCFLVTKNYTLAKDKFILLINDAKYGNDSRYYYGYIAYKLEDYGIAASTLKKIENNETYKLEISYYLLDINFKAANFERCIIIGKGLLENAKRKQKSDISKIIGESYFNLKKYAESIPYLLAFKGKKGKWSNTDFYQLGYAYYKQNDFENAINYFNKIIDQKNAISQNAYSHLGECYLKTDQKAEALNAFKSASEMNFDLKIKQDAALNYAKLSYEAGNPFKSVAEVLQDYLKEYPKSKEYDQINELVVSSFLHQQNYEGALAFLSQNKRDKNLILSQEISLYRGMQLFNELKLTEAFPYFINASKSTDKEVQNIANYWEAETTYQLGDYKNALQKFELLSKSVDKNTTDKNLKRISYNIGYSNFKIKKYEEAAAAFGNFLKKDALDEITKDDALVRIGDCYFASKKYETSINAYKKVIEKQGVSADYAQYQIGMIYGFTGDNIKKVEALKKVVNEYSISTLKDDALFQIATTQTTLKNTDQAIIAYDKLLEKHPTSIFTSKALVRQGLLFYNNNQGDKALERYKEVAKKFPNSSDALEAVANARNVYIDKGNLDDYVSWISSLKFFNVTNSDLDNTTFAVAEKSYFESKDADLIIKNLTKYVNGFPDGIHKIKVNYYLADVYFKVKKYNSAITFYEIVLEEEQNEFSEDALSKLTQIYLEKEDYNNALPLLDRLEQEAYAAENVLYAQSNLMKAYYETEAYDFALEYAKKLLLRDKIDNNLALDAKNIIAKSAFKNKDFFTAEEYYLDIEKSAKGVLKAEALYYNAYFKNQQEDYTASNKVVQKLIANYSTHKYWAVKSYVIMGKNYYGLKDVYQATFVLENVIKNFKQFEDIVFEAESELNKIKEQEAKTNNSISTPEDKN